MRDSSIKRIIQGVLRLIFSFKIFNRPVQKLARAGILPPSIWKRLPIVTDFTINAPDGKKYLYHLITGDFIGNKLFWQGDECFEFETLDLFYRLAKSSKLVLDIGANTGLYTLLAATANSECRVIAFEPVEQIHKTLCTHLEINGLTSRCSALNQAVSDHIGIIDIHVPEGSVPSSASLDTSGFRGFEGKLVEVTVTTADAIIKEGEIVNLIKIDVEGFEDRVLAGMTNILAKSKPKIIIEILPDGPNAQIEKILKENDYIFYLVKDDGPVASEKIIPDQNEIFRNYLCVHKDDAKVIANLS